MPGRNQPAPPNRVQLQISHIGKKHGPVPISAVVTEMPKFDGPKMATVRFLAPAFYRRHVAGVTKDDDPTTVIVAVAANVGCRASLLTGGKWEVANHPHGRILIGHIKVNESLAEKLQKKIRSPSLVCCHFGHRCQNRCCLGASSKTNFWRLLQTITHTCPSPWFSSGTQTRRRQWPRSHWHVPDWSFCRSDSHVGTSW